MSIPNIIITPFPPVSSITTTTAPTRFEVRIPIDLLHHLDPKLAVHLLPAPGPDDPLNSRLLERDYARPMAEKLAQKMHVMLFGTEPAPFRSMSIGYIEQEREGGEIAERPYVGFRLERNVTRPGLDPQVFTLTAEKPLFTLTKEKSHTDDGENELVFRTVEITGREERDLLNYVADTSTYGEAPRPRL